MKDYKDYSFNEFIGLISDLYKEIDRLTAERKASQEALEKLTDNIRLSEYSYGRIKDTVQKTVEETLVALKKRKPAKKSKSVKRAKR